MKKVRLPLVVLLFLVAYLTCIPVSYAYKEVSRYRAADGFTVVSYSQYWNTPDKLKEIYQELLNNYHGEEYKLLTRINIYPGPSPDGQDVAGHWFGSWRIVKDGYQLLPNRYINLYYGDTIKDVMGFARTLSHEYGHHFTYYYYFKKEKKPWSKWRTTEFAKVRGIARNPYIGTGEKIAHAWQVEEIAANDYVQIFGSINAKKSQAFKDIEERAKSGNMEYTYSNNIFNLSPQENPLLSLAADVESIREYWVGTEKQAKLYSNNPPRAPILSLEKVSNIGAQKKQYIFSWSEGSDEASSDLEYTLVRYNFSPVKGEFRISPVKTVNGGGNLRAVYGAVLTGNTYYWEVIPKDVQLFTVYLKDAKGLMVSSNSLAVDFTDAENPDYISVSVQEMNSGSYFKPRVKMNDKQLTFDVEPEIINKTTMIPFRAIFAELGAEVSWDASTRTIKAVKGDITLSLTVDEPVAVINEKIVELSVPPRIKNGRAIVPLRLVSEAFGAQVKWNPRLHLVNIDL